MFETRLSHDSLMILCLCLLFLESCHSWSCCERPLFVATLAPIRHLISLRAGQILGLGQCARYVSTVVKYIFPPFSNVYHFYLIEVCKKMKSPAFELCNKEVEEPQSDSLCYVRLLDYSLHCKCLQTNNRQTNV